MFSHDGSQDEAKKENAQTIVVNVHDMPQTKDGKGDTTEKEPADFSLL